MKPRARPAEKAAEAMHLSLLGNLEKRGEIAAMREREKRKMEQAKKWLKEKPKVMITLDGRTIAKEMLRGMPKVRRKKK